MHIWTESRFAAVKRGILAMLLLLAAVTIFSAAPKAQTETSSPPAKVEELLQLLGDPEVQKWLDAQKAAKAATAPANPVAQEKMAIEANFERIRRHLASLAAAIPTFPQELGRVLATVHGDMMGYGLLRVLAIFAAFAAAGVLAQWLFWRLAAGLRAWIASANLATVQDRLIAMFARLAYSAGSVLAFAAGSIGAFLAFGWPPRLHQIIIAYLVAVLIYRSARVLLEFLLSPPDLKGFGDSARFRVLPVSDARASYWVRRFSLAIGWYAFGSATVGLLGALGLSLPARQLVAYALGLVLLAIGAEAVWNRPVDSRAAGSPAAETWFNAKARTYLLILSFFILWVLWVESATWAFWLMAVFLALPLAITAARNAVNNVLRPAGSAPGGNEIPSVIAAVVERGLRVALVAAAVVFLANRLGIDFTTMTAQDTVGTRLMRGALSATIILLTADFVWHVTKTVIERKIAESASMGAAGSDLARRRDRIRTLLPIARNVLMIVIAVVAILMALSSLGVEIGPLIAGAGILGVAIGFGAQTVVKDIISGVFYLLDDAFRVGEYIQSGSYKGTVESFSLRSVKLRHHRGSIYTVPFSDLGAIQNMSRDWAIDKITLTITYDFDVDLARKIVKKIGLELAQDPEFAAATLQPLKMQGIDEFGESGLMLRMKIMTRPGEQFTIKRRALMMIKKAFDENGIKLAVPTVQVSGDSDPKTAAANQLRRKKQQAAAAPA